MRWFDEAKEFGCRCRRRDCDAPKALDPQWGDMLDNLRDRVGRPIVIASSRETKQLREAMQKLSEEDQKRCQVAIHAVQPTTVEAALNALEYAVEQLPRPNHRHRIEHCTLPGPRSLRRMQELGLVPLPQPVFLFAEGEAYRDRLQKVAFPVSSVLSQASRFI